LRRVYVATLEGAVRALRGKTHPAPACSVVAIVFAITLTWSNTGFPPHPGLRSGSEAPPDAGECSLSSFVVIKAHALIPTAAGDGRAGGCDAENQPLDG
jgi:hypothetical protein